MNNTMLLLIVSMLLSTNLSAQSSAELQKIESAVMQFSVGGDRQDVAALDKVLHPQFRAVVNRLFGSPDLSVMDKALYLQLIGEKKIGGDTREVHLLHVEVGQHVATVKALFQGKALKFTTFISLVKMVNGDWLVVGDMPEIEKV